MIFFDITFLIFNYLLKALLLIELNKLQIKGVTRDGKISL